MKYIKIFSCLLLIVGLIIISNSSFAQCAMCQATVESNLKGGGSTAKGLNSGIMYLLAAPYVMILGIGLLWYKKYRKKDVVIDMKEQKINLN
jgi:preprotein translocase subunit SecG